MQKYGSGITVQSGAEYNKKAKAAAKKAPAKKPAAKKEK